jgi:hypothetical protein
VQLPMVGNDYPMELVLGGGRVLRIGADVNPQRVCELVQALERQC